MQDQIRNLIENARIKDALTLLATKVPDASALLTTFNDASHKHMLGVLDYKEFSQKQSQVVYAALEMLNGIENKPSSAPPAEDGGAAASPSANAAKKVFISYSHKDEAAMRELDKFLGPLERKGDISIWTDRKILPGQKWKDQIMRELECADLTLLLVSANFLDSDFINTEEIPRALHRSNEHGKHVIPIILDYCLWDITSLKDFQATPKDGRPIADYQNAAQAWNEVARGILGLLSSGR